MKLDIKTTKQIINDELGVILNSVDYDINNALFEINKNKKWVSVESITEFFKYKYQDTLLEKFLQELDGDDK